MTQYAVPTTPISGGTIDYAIDNRFAVAKLSATVYVKFFTQTTPYHILCQVVQLNGTSAPTVGTTTVVNSQAAFTIQAYGLDSTTAIVMWQNAVNGNVSATLVTVSGTTATPGSDVAEPFGESIAANDMCFVAWPTTAGNMRLAYQTINENVEINTASYSGNTLTPNVSGATQELVQGISANNQSNLYIYDVPGSTNKLLVSVAGNEVGALTFNAAGTLLTAATVSYGLSGSVRMFPRNSSEYVAMTNTTSISTIVTYTSNDLSTSVSSTFTRISGTLSVPLINIIPLGNDQWLLTASADSSPTAGTGNLLGQVMKITETGTTLMGTNVVTVATAVYPNIINANYAVPVDNSFNSTTSLATAWVDTGTSYDLLVFSAP
jgi:hypothetical protein